MRLFSICVLLWLALITFATPKPARGAEEPGGYKLVPLQATVEKAISNNSDVWRACGAYFAAIEAPKEKVVLFSFRGFLFGSPFTNFRFVDTAAIHVSVNEKAESPTIILNEDRYLLTMNLKDYRIALPCLGRGEKI